MSKLSKKRYCGLLNDLADENCHCDYCFLKLFLETLHPDPRVLMQIKCIEKFKYERSKELGHDIGWNDAGILWAEEGWATAFQTSYSKFEKIFEQEDQELSVKMIYDYIRVLMVKYFNK